MRRRKFITLLGGAAVAWPLAAGAQQSEVMRRIGVLTPYADNDVDALAHVTAFQQALQKLGWTEGRSVRIDVRWGGGNVGRIQAHAVELAALNPDVILAVSSQALQPLQRAASGIPIVFTQIADPVGSGFVASLAHPGGNITGFTPAEFSLYAKSLEVLKETAPQVARVAILLIPELNPQVGMWRAIQAAAPSLKVQLTAADARNAAEIERVIDAFARERNGGLIVLPNSATIVHRELIIALATKHRLPAVYPYRYFVADGGLISYGVDLADQYRQVASYVDRILRGDKPADLPVQAPTKYELVINLKTAKALGLTIPPSLLTTADAVLE